MSIDQNKFYKYRNTGSCKTVLETLHKALKDVCI